MTDGIARWMQGQPAVLVANPTAHSGKAADWILHARGLLDDGDVGLLEVERGGKPLHKDLFFDSFSIGLGAASLATRNRDRERIGRIPGLGAIYRDQLVYIGAVARRFAESYVVDIAFELDATIDGVAHRFDRSIPV